MPIEALVRAQLGHFDDLVGRRIGISGHAIKINAAAAQAIALALHELATNAAKYGALSNANSLVNVSWTLNDNGAEPRFILSWTESGGPAVCKPARRGFGSTVTGILVKMSLDGDVETDYATEGFKWRLSCSKTKVVEKTQGLGRNKTTSTRYNFASDSRRILVVEDEPLIAMQIATMLERAGFEVLGPVASVDQALALVERSGCAAAVLDVNLANETAEPVALRLTQSGTHFVTISGYGRNQLPSSFGSAPYFGKPIDAAGILRCLERCLDSVPKH